MQAKREQERVKAEKFAAWEKRQQAVTEQQIRDRHNPQSPTTEQHDEQDDDENSVEQQGRAEVRYPAADDDDDGVLAVRRLDITKPTSTRTPHTTNPPAATTDPHITTSASATSAVPQFAPLETSGQPLRNKLRTLFAKESTEEVEHRKALSRQPLRRHTPLDGHCPSIDPWRTVIPLPPRPSWTANTSAQQLHEAEEAAFTAWLESIYGRCPAERLNHFEHNLEVWRQLWRVVEQSDVLLCIVDVRFPLINFPPALYDYVVTHHHKPLVMILNKVDLVPRRVVDDWQRYFHRLYPQLPVIAYTSKPRTETGSTNEGFDVLVRNRWKVAGGSLVLGDAYGVDELMEVCRTVVRERVAGLSEEVKDKFSFEPTYIIDAEGKGGDDEKKDAERDEVGDEEDEDEASKGKSRGKTRRRQKRGENKPSHDDDGDEDEEEGDEEAAEDDDEHEAEERPSEPPARYSQLFGKLDDQPTATSTSSTRPPTSFITIGTIGAPNAGKSSLINSLAHRKLVSVSKTPGHTKYLQTLFLNRYTRLCDAPGLVFPAVDMPRALQVLAGCFPIAQTRDPYSAVKLLAECVPLERVYKLRPVPVDERGEHTYEEEGKWEWTAWSLCEAMAWQKGYRNKHGVLDLYRAANAILRDELDGTVVMYTTPPDDDKRAKASVATAEKAEDGGRGKNSGANERVKGRGKHSDREADEDGDAGGHQAVSKHGKRGKKGKGKRRQHSSDDDEDETE